MAVLRLLSALLLGGLMLLASCTGSPAPTAAPTSGLPTSSLNRRPTLPPSWTPTSPPPTATATPLPSITPTPREADLCAAVSPTQVTHMGEVIFLLLEADNPAIRLNVAFTNLDNQESFAFSVSGGRQTAATLPTRDLPGAGDYEWVVTAQIGDREGLCTQRGRFVVVARPPLDQLLTILAEGGVAVTAVPVAPATAEATPPD